MRIAICDDNPQDLEHISDIVTEHFSANPQLDGSLYRFASPDLLLNNVAAQGPFDAYIMDIIMEDINGIELGNRLRSLGDSAPIIYLTSSLDFAIASYQVRAFGYLVKPIQAAALVRILNELSELWRQSTQRAIMVRTSTGIYPVYPGELIYLEVYKHSFLYHLSGGRTVESAANQGSLDAAAAPLLEDPRFVKINRGQVVNMSYIAKLSGNDFYLEGLPTLHISRLLASGVKSRYIDYLLERGRSL